MDGWVREPWPDEVEEVTPNEFTLRDDEQVLGIHSLFSLFNLVYLLVFLIMIMCFFVFFVMYNNCFVFVFCTRMFYIHKSLIYLRIGVF